MAFFVLIIKELETDIDVLYRFGPDEQLGEPLWREAPSTEQAEPGTTWRTTSVCFAANLRFTGNSFLSLWNGIATEPFQISNPDVVGGFVAANSLATLTHIATVYARWMTDESDNVQYMLS